MKIEDKRKRNWFWVENAILHLDLDVYEKMVFITLCQFADAEGQCYPSLQTIAKAASCSRRKVSAVIAKLIAKKMITKVNRISTSGDKTSNVYTIHSLHLEGGRAPRALPSAPRALGVGHHVPINNTNNTYFEQDTTTNVVPNAQIEEIRSLLPPSLPPLSKKLIIDLIKEKGFETVFTIAEMIAYQIRKGGKPPQNWNAYFRRLVLTGMERPAGFVSRAEKEEKERRKREEEEKERREREEMRKNRELMLAKVRELVKSL